jgi:hypothetical protein
MIEDPMRNRQSGAPVAQSTEDSARVASADRREGLHYEADPDQLVKVVHQVKPAAIPVQGPTDYGERGGPQDNEAADVAVTPETASVWEARPHDPTEP